VVMEVVTHLINVGVMLGTTKRIVPCITVTGCRSIHPMFVRTMELV